MKKKDIVLGITGSIAAFKACDLIGQYRKHGFDVTCILTREAGHFITPMTIETLSGNKVFCDMFEPPEMRSPRHVSLAEKAGLVTVSPASANIIGKLAHGICDDLLTCVICATRAPVLLAPAMNDKMYENRIVQRNINTLRGMGYRFIGPIRGHLACGSRAIGHLAETDDIVKESKKLVKGRQNVRSG